MGAENLIENQTHQNILSVLQKLMKASLAACKICPKKSATKGSCVSEMPT